MTARAFQVHAWDNVATAIADVASGSSVRVIGPGSTAEPLVAIEAIAQGHKLALCAMAEGEAVFKFGVPIGRASHGITRGAWVHLHNCASLHDTRSGTLDLHTGAPTDTANAYV